MIVHEKVRVRDRFQSEDIDLSKVEVLLSHKNCRTTVVNIALLIWKLAKCLFL